MCLESIRKQGAPKKTGGEDAMANGRVVTYQEIKETTEAGNRSVKDIYCRPGPVPSLKRESLKSRVIGLIREDRPVIDDRRADSSES